MSRERNQSLDALRGYAILTMILSGTIAFGGILPNWMYHAQVPPPLHKFDPSIPGITWVDLVFPFFLFSMGTAIPLALKKLENDKKATQKVWIIAGRRYLLLTWFALFFQHMKPNVQSANPGTIEYILAFFAFVILFLALYKPANNQIKWPSWMSYVGYALSVVLFIVIPFQNGKGFQFTTSDIIILVLANMAFFGTLVYWYTRHTPIWRLGILALIVAIFLGGKTANSINAAILDFTPIPWMYKFYYLKYLCIIIPGTFAGEWMLQSNEDRTSSSKINSFFVALLALVIIVSNTTLLFTRQLTANFILSLLLLGLMGILLMQSNRKSALVKNYFQAGSFCLVLGLLLESFEGGIHKDPSNHSYYFVTSGLAFFALLFFNGWSIFNFGKIINSLLAAVGRNPMVAYVGAALVVIPLFQLTGLYPAWSSLNGNAFAGLAKGLIATGLVAVLTIIFTRKKWYWKS